MSDHNPAGVTLLGQLHAAILRSEHLRQMTTNADRLVEQLYARLLQIEPARGGAISLDPPAGICPICETPTTGRAQYCSPKCRQKAYRARSGLD